MIIVRYVHVCYMCIISSRPSNLTKNLKGVYFCPPFIIYRSIVDNYVAICFCFAVMISHGFHVMLGAGGGGHQRKIVRKQWETQNIIDWHKINPGMIGMIWDDRQNHHSRPNHPSRWDDGYLLPGGKTWSIWGQKEAKLSNIFFWGPLREEVFFIGLFYAWRKRRST